MATMTPRDAADFRIRGLLGWGATLSALGVLLVALAWIALPDRLSAYPDEGSTPTILLVLALLALVPGLVSLQVGLVAAGVRLGLVAHGIPRREDAATD